MRTHIITTALALAMGVLLAGGPAAASSHREAPAIADDPAADNTDVWAWVSPGDHGKLYVIASYVPLEEPSGGPNFHSFSDEVLYEIHLTRGASTRDALVYQFRFRSEPFPYVDPADLDAPLGGGKEFFAQLSGRQQTYTVRKIENGRARTIARDVPVAPPNIGPRTDEVVYGAPYDDDFAATFIKELGAEGRVWAGPRDDGFYVDLGGVFDLANLRAKGTAQDGVAGYNAHTIALEIPTSVALGRELEAGEGPSNDTLVGVWASASRRKVSVRLNNGREFGFGPWVQVSRLGLPLVNEAVIGLQDKDVYNRTTPVTDVPLFGAYFLNPIVVRDAEAVGIYAALGVDPTPFKSNRLDIIDVINLTNIPTEGAHSIPLEQTGDILRVDVAVDSAFPNGRSLEGGAYPDREQADVTDVLLSLILAKFALTVSDGVDYNDKPYLTEFPFLALPWRGFDEGHGKPTP